MESKTKGLKQVYNQFMNVTNAVVSKIVQLNDDKFLCGLFNAIGKFIKKSDYDYQFIQDNQRLITKGQITSIMLVNFRTIAYTDSNGHYLKIFDILKRYYKNSIKLSESPHIFRVQEYDYETNPFAFLKDEEKISLINLRNCQIIKIIDAKYNHLMSWNKNGSLINKRVASEDGKFYRLVDLQRDEKFFEIREIMIKAL
ncbi:UNKNOWN [Stylonychia lemnae]|uniref:Uncharacterized protein n=1 Tax=Stylonychia lemnae TaxID=5949 RepID=A0A077ZRF7_STYLE|nr:UNKNOWN [Stylonychia lemnae]|eukprot:CDW72039.1 UNKNOWN [Stylonychia lemnae]